MSGRFVEVVLPPTNPSVHDRSDACYFIVMEHPLACVAAASHGLLTVPVTCMLDTASNRVKPTGYSAYNRGVNLPDAMKKDGSAPCEDSAGCVMSDQGEEGFGVSVITVDTVSGQLLYTGVPQKDRFISIHEAIHAIPALCPRIAEEFEVQTVCEFVAFAGGCLSENAVHLLFIESGRLLSVGDDGCVTFPCLESKRCVPPILSVEKAQWYNIPLRVAIPALQQPLSNGGVQSWVLGSNIMTPMEPLSVSSALATEGNPPYLYFSPGVDVTHCGVFTEAIRHCVTPEDVGGNPPASCGVSVVEFLPSLPARTGRDALGHCDCLWNEELIAFCDIFGLGDWCCRLALGSCSTIVLSHPPLTPHIAFLLVRWSRLAFHGCLYDYSPVFARPKLDEYFSTLETEFQLIILHEPQCSHGDRVKEPFSSFKWRRGADFACHTDLLVQTQRFIECTARFKDSLPPHEGHVAGIFLGYMERYGLGTRISLVHAGRPDTQGGFLVDNVISPGTHKYWPPHGRDSPIKTSIRSSSLTAAREISLLTQSIGDVSGQYAAVDALAASYSLSGCGELKSTLQLLAKHVRENNLGLFVSIGSLSLPTTSSSFLEKQEERETNDAFLQMYWGDEGEKKTVLHSSRENWVPRVCVSDETETSIVASILVSLSWVVPWVSKKLCGCNEVELEVGQQVALVDTLIFSIVTSAAGFTRIRAACMRLRVLDLLRRCLTSVLEMPPALFSPVVWATSQYVVQLCLSMKDSSDDVDAEAINAKKKFSHSTVLGRHMVSFVTGFFLSDGIFYPREFLRHRIVLLSHPSQLSLIISAHLMAAQSAPQHRDVTEMSKEDSPNVQKRRLFPFTPMKSLNPSLSFDESFSPVLSSTEGQRPTLSMLRGLAHPFSQPLLVSSCFDAVEFTVALPALSFITHVAITVADAVQEAPYAAALALSLSTCCYVGQAHERVVLEEVLLPLCLGCSTDRSGGHAAPRMIFYELHRRGHRKIPYSVIEGTHAGISHTSRRFHDTTPVIARFLRFSVRGSGYAPMALPPVLVFGEAIHCIPQSEQHAVVGCKTTIRQMLLKTSLSPYFRSQNGDKEQLNEASPPSSFLYGVIHQPDVMRKGEVTKMQLFAEEHNGDEHNDQKHLRKCNDGAHLTAHERQEMYVHLLVNAIRGELSQLNLTLVVELESKRLQCRVRRHYREFCLHRIGAPRWVMDPVCQVFPHSVSHRSRLPEGVEDIALIEQRQRSPRGGCSVRWERKRREDRRHCAICSSRFSWFSVPKECGRCHRHVCKKCYSKEFVPLPDVGLRVATARVCLDCLKKVDKLSRVLRNFAWSEAEGEVDTEVETAEAIDFYTRCTTPQLASTMAFCSVHSNILQWGKQSLINSRIPPYQLTMYPLTRVVSAPSMDDAAAPLFEEVLGVPGLGGNNALSTWCCVSDDEWTESTTRVSRHVLLLLPHPSIVSHGLLHYSLSGKPQGAVEVQMHVGSSLKALHHFHTLHIGGPKDVSNTPGTNTVLVTHENANINASNNSSTMLKLMHKEKISPPCDTIDGLGSLDSLGSSLLVSIIFVGPVTDLALLRVAHFSVWGRFTPDVLLPHRGYYRCRPKACRYGSLLPSAACYTSGVLGVACLPRMLPMTRLIAVRNAIVHSHTDSMLLEFDFGVSSTVCGFTLELHHPAALTAADSGIATVLRLIGVLASGYRGNMGYFQLPWPPLPSCDSSSGEPFAYAYSLPSTAFNVVSVLVEVLEWRLVDSVRAERRKNSNRVAECVGSGHSSGDCDGGGSFTDVGCVPRRGIYLGKVQFWTSTNAAARHMVSGRTFFSIHAALDDSHY